MSVDADEVAESNNDTQAAVVTPGTVEGNRPVPKLRTINMEKFLAAGRPQPGESLKDIYPYRTMEVGKALIFDNLDQDDRRRGLTIRTYAVKHAKETGKKFSYKNIGNGECALVRMK